MSLTLPELLARHALHPFPALIERGNTVSFAALAEASRRVAGGLSRLGVAPGDRVALWLPSTTAWLTVFFACAQLGAIAVAVNTRFRSHELNDVLARSGAKVLVFWPDFKGIDFGGTLAACDTHALERLQSVVAYSEDGMPAPRSLAGKAVFDYATLSFGEPLAENRANAEAACAMFTTSGTTNAPKFVLHSHRAVIGHALDVAHRFAIGADSLLLLIPPLCGVYGFCSAMAALAAGR
ncbi:MAG: AMP-binding protein, partial [Betaproteobacteria bacterium]|nr:AMP-binding protein [Betaproteobacteria bacterium]